MNIVRSNVSVILDIIVVTPEILELSLLFSIFLQLNSTCIDDVLLKGIYEKGKIFKVFGDLVIEFEDENNDSKKRWENSLDNRQ